MNTKTVNEPMLWAMNSNSVVSFLMMDKANQCCENWNDRVGFWGESLYACFLNIIVGASYDHPKSDLNRYIEYRKIDAIF